MNFMLMTKQKNDSTNRSKTDPHEPFTCQYLATTNHRRLHGATLQLRLFLVICAVIAVVLFKTAAAEAAYSITPATWNVIGLDSNSPAFGPKNFPVGAKVCGGTVGGTDTVTLVWDSGGTDNGTYIYTRPGSANPVNVTFGANGCADAFFEVEVNQTSAAYEQTRRYHITESNGGTSTPTPRELFVERLVSQARNSIANVEYGTSLASMTSVPAGGALNLIVGNTYYIKLYGGTATQGYNQFVDFINFSNTIFQTLSVTTNYSANDSPYVSTTNWPYLYADACQWENNPLLPTYRSCIGGDYKTGGTNVVTTYQVKILSGGGSTETLNTLLFDFSGASYHYNGDYSTGARIANVIDPNMINFSKSFSPNQNTPSTPTQLKFTITNPNAAPLSGYNFTDIFPTTPGNMTYVSTVDNTCSGSTLTDSSGGALAAGAVGVKMTNISLPASGSCTLTVNVQGDAASATPYSNAATLYLGATSTGQTASAELTIGATSAGTGVCGTPMATWKFPSGSNVTSPAPTTASITATASTGTGISTPPIINTPTHDTGTLSWQSNGAIATGATLTTSNNDYFEFALNTTGYTSVDISFWAARGGNNSASGVAVYYGTSNSRPETGTRIDSLGNTYLGTGNTTGVWQPINITNFSVNAATSYFRIYFYNSGNSTPGSDVYLDDVVFTGCGPAIKPTISKAFTAPKTVAVTGSNTLTFTLNNTNALNMTGAAFADTLPSINLQGSVSTSGAPTTTITGSGTAFKSQLAVGSDIFINGTGYNVTAISSDTQLTVSPAVGSNLSSATASAGMTAVSTTATQCTTGAVTISTDKRTISMSGGTIPASSSCTVTALVKDSVSGPLTNTSGFLTTAQGGTNTGSIATDTLTALLPPVITKSFSPNPIQEGNNSTLTFTVTNPNKTSPLDNVSFSDNLPAVPAAMKVATFTGVTTNGCGTPTFAPAANATVLNFSGGTIAAGSTCTVTVNVTAPANATEYTNTSGTVSATYAGNGNTATAKLKVNPVFPEITILKQVSGNATGPWVNYLGVTAGSNVYFKFLVENDGDVPLSNISVSDEEIGIPSCTWIDGDGATLIAPFTLPVATASSNAYYASCVAGPITAVSGYHESIATAYGTYNGVQYSDQDWTIYATTGIVLTKKATPASFAAQGNILTYSYEIINTGFTPLAGPAAVADNKVTVTCPALTTIGNNDSNLDAYATTGEKLICSASYIVSSADSAAEQVTNTATATVGAVNSLPVSLTVPMVSSPPDMTMMKSNDTAGPILTGTPFNWTLLLNNSPAGGAASFANGQTIITDDLPSGATYVISSIAKSGIGGTINCTVTSDTLNCQAGGSVIIYGGLFGTVTVTNGSAAVTGTGTAFTSQLAIGSTLLINGTSYSVASIVNDTSLTLTQNYTGADASGLSIPSTLKVVIKATPTTGGLLANPRVGGNCKADPNNVVTESDKSNNNCPTNTVSVYGPPTISKSFTPANIASGGNSTLIITIGNSHPAAITLTNALTDTLPAGMTISAANTGTCAGISAAIGSGTITMANGTSVASGSCSIIVGVTSSTVGAAVNTIPVGALQTSIGSNTLAATATANIFIAPTITKNFAPATITSGSTSALTLTLGNPAANPATVTGLIVADTFPAGLTLKDISFTFTPAACGSITSFSGAASIAGDNNIRFTAASINPGNTCKATVNVTSSTLGTVNNITATPSAVGPVALTGSNATAPLTVSSQPSAAKTFGSASINYGATTTLIFTLTNVAPNPAQSNIALGDTLPTGLQFNSLTPAVTYSSGCSGPATAVYTPATRVLSGLTTIAMAVNTASCTVTVAGITNQNLQSGTCPDIAFTNLAANVTTSNVLNSSIDQCLQVFGNTTLTIVKTADKGTAKPNDIITYTLLVTNTGQAPASNISISDILSPYIAFGTNSYPLAPAPTGPAFDFFGSGTVPAPDTPQYFDKNNISITPSGAYDGNVAKWIIPFSIGTLGGGDSFTIRYRTQVK